MSDDTDRLLGDQIADMLAEEDAEAYDRNDSVSMSLVGDAEIWRVWPELSPDIIPQAIAFLDKYASVKNFEKNTPLKYVDDPRVGRETWSGRWRVAYVRKVTQGEVPKLVQVLRKGFAQEIKWDEARYAGELQYDGNPDISHDPPVVTEREKFLDVKWANCDPAKTHELAESLRGQTITNPVVHGEPIEGEWKTLIVATAVEEDGSAVVTAKLAIPGYTLTSFDNWLTSRSSQIVYRWGCTREESQAILDEWKTLGGAGSSATCSNNRETGLIDLILRGRIATVVHVTALSALDCRYSESTDYYFGVSDPEAYPIAAGSAGNGVSYTRSLRDNGDGTYDILLTTRTVVPREVGKLAGEEVYTHNEQEFHAETVFQLGLSKIRDRLSIAEETPGQVKTQRIDIRDDCSVDAVTVKEIAKANKTNYSGVVSAASTTVTSERLAVEVATPDNMDDKIVAGSIVRVVRKLSRFFNRWDETVEKTTPNNQIAEVAVGMADGLGYAAGESHTSADRDETIQNLASGITSPAGGQRIEYAESRNEVGKLAYRKVVHYGRNIELWARIVKDYFGQRSTKEERVATGTLDSGAISTVAGSIEQSPSEYYGRYNTRLETVVPQERRMPSSANTSMRIFNGEDQEVHIWRKHNAPISDIGNDSSTAQAQANEVGFSSGATGKGGNVSVEAVSYNGAGRLDYTKALRINKSPVGTTEYVWWTRGDVYWIPTYDALHGTGKVVGGTPWVESYKHCIKYFTTMPLAVKYLNNEAVNPAAQPVLAAALNMALNGSSVDKVADGLWRAHKIQRQDVKCGEYVAFL